MKIHIILTIIINFSLLNCELSQNSKLEQGVNVVNQSNDSILNVVFNSNGELEIFQSKNGRRDKDVFIQIEDSLGFQFQNDLFLFIIYSVSSNVNKSITINNSAACAVISKKNSQLKVISNFNFGFLGNFSAYSTLSMYTNEKDAPIFFIIFTDIGQGIVSENLRGFIWENNSLKQIIQIPSFCENNFGACDSNLANCYGYNSKILNISNNTNGVFVLKEGTDFNSHSANVAPVADTIFYEFDPVH